MITLSHEEPFVVLIDLDNTIQGNVEPQLEESNLCHIINSQNPGGPKLKQDKKLLHKDFAKGLLRPNFKKFIRRMKDRFPNVEFFVYTASNSEWGKYVVKNIEALIGITFNKRVFTRDDCIWDPQRRTYYKSIKKVSPDIFTCLKAKYKLVGKKQEHRFKHIILIDNNDVLRDEEKKYLVKCPDYNHKVVINPFRSIPDHVIRQHYKLIGKYLWNKDFRNVYRFYSESFDHLEKRHTSALGVNATDDKYWDYQLKIFKREYQIV